MRGIVCAIIGFALAAMPLHAQKAAAESLQNSSAWNVNYSEDRCRLVREFGAGEAATIVIFDFYQPGQAFKLTVAGKRFGSVKDGHEAALRFGPNEELQRTSYFVGEIGKDRPAVVFANSLRFDNRPPQKDGRDSVTEPLSAARIAAVTELEIDAPASPPVRLLLGSMRAPLAAVDKCTNELLVRWGIDPRVNAQLSRKVRPIGGPQAWLTNADYPKALLRQGVQGFVEARFNVDEHGVPTACHIQRSSGSIEFDEMACATLKTHARFLPALDSAGKPVASFYQFSMTFRI